MVELYKIYTLKNSLYLCTVIVIFLLIKRYSIYLTKFFLDKYGTINNVKQSRENLNIKFKNYLQLISSFY